MFLKNFISTDIIYSMKYFIIAENELEKLIESSIEFECLKSAGVDNWEWYGDAFSEIDSIEQEVEKIKSSYRLFEGE